MDKGIEMVQTCMNCKFWKKDGRWQCTHQESKKCWFANQVNGCEFFDGELSEFDYSKAWAVGYRPSTFGK